MEPETSTPRSAFKSRKKRRPRSASFGTNWRSGRPTRRRNNTLETHAGPRRVAMDLSRLTQKSQDALREAQTLGVRHGHQEVDADHLALALLQQEDGLLPRLLVRMQAPADALRTA